MQFIDFLEAVKLGRYRQVKNCLKKNPKFLNKEDCFGATPLVVAARFGLFHMIRLLLHKGADFRKVTDVRTHPCFIALSNNDDKITFFLLNLQKKLGIVKEMTVLNEALIEPACHLNRVDIIKYLHEAFNVKLYLNPATLIYSKSVESFEYIFSKLDNETRLRIADMLSVSVSKKYWAIIIRYCGVKVLDRIRLNERLILHSALVSCKKNRFQWFLEQGVDPYACYPNGKSLLRICLQFGVYQNTQSLLSKGTDRQLMLRNDSEGNLLMHIFNSSFIENGKELPFVLLLLQYGIKLPYKTHLHYTRLIVQRSLELDEFKSIHQSLDDDCRAQLIKIYGSDMLCEFIRTQCLNGIKWCLINGVDPNGRALSCQTPLKYAMHLPDTDECINLLLAFGAKPQLNQLVNQFLPDRLSLIKTLLAFGGDNPARDMLSRSLYMVGNTVPFNPEQARHLILLGANPFFKHDVGISAYATICRENHTDLIELCELFPFDLQYRCRQVLYYEDLKESVLKLRF